MCLFLFENYNLRKSKAENLIWRFQSGNPEISVENPTIKK